MLFRRFILIIFMITGLSTLIFLRTTAQETHQQNIVTVLTIQGAIGPAVQDYVTQGIKTSEKMHANVIVLTLDTPGGLDSAMRGIIQSILNSSIPVLTYVYPSGARAASAGTYILYASHLAAMAPGTNLGAATPVNMMSSEQNHERERAISKKQNREQKPSDTRDDREHQQATKSTEKRKALNDATAYIRSLAQLRHRNETWAVKAVSQAASLSAEEALKLNVINFVVASIPDLLKAANGKTVSIKNTATQINTQSATLFYIKPNWHNQILKVITDPSVAYILLMIGVYGLFFEFMNPGYVAPGVIGALSLLLALYAFQLLPINYAGFILIVLGIIFMVAESFLPSFGALGLGGIVGFLIGSFLLFETDVPGFGLPWQIIIGMTITTGLLMIILLQLLLRSRHKPVVSGAEAMIGKTGIIEKDDNHIWVIVNGERWKAESNEVLLDQQKVKIVRVNGLVLFVKAASLKE